MMKFMLLKLILLASGPIALAACETIQQAALVVTEIQKPPGNCPPIVPDLPGVNNDNIVVLYPKDQQALLLYFHQVERCYQSSAQGTGL